MSDDDDTVEAAMRLARGPRDTYRDPSRYLARGLLPTLPLASFEADSVRMPESPQSLPTRALHALADAIPENKGLPPPQFPMDPRSLSLAHMLSGAARTSGDWADWQSKSRPEDYSPADILAPSGGAAMGLMARAAPSAIAAGAKEAAQGLERDRTLDALRYHLRQIGHDEGGWPSRLGKAAFAASPLAVEAAFAPFQGAAAPWMLGTTAAASALSAATQLVPHYRMLMDKRDYLRAMDKRQAERAMAETSAPSVLADSSRGSLPGTIVNGLEQQAPAYALGPNLRPTPADHPFREQGREMFHHHILRDGEKLGSLSGNVSGDTAHIGWIGASGQENNLGLAGMRALREAFRELYPDVTQFDGGRVSGARTGPAADRSSVDYMQSVRLPSDPLASLPGTVLSPPRPQEQDVSALQELLARYGVR